MAGVGDSYQGKVRDTLGEIFKCGRCSACNAGRVQGSENGADS